MEGPQLQQQLVYHHQLEVQQQQVDQLLLEVQLQLGIQQLVDQLQVEDQQQQLEVQLLLNPSTAAFTSRASIIKSTLEPFYQKAFSSFRFLKVISFSSGSIINNLALTFSSTSIPNNTQIGNVLVRAASNITAFNVDTTSISVDGTQVSSGVSHKISLITASFLVILSWLLSSQQ
ncbi:uncharacterized protein LOC116049076 isoform X2 [Sander lucioperca]|uniref:uncharacterized protein LOC116049076 isoform X2 n=1 Tax=Sander lucioperca TaxID=283035 RepID=UPI001653B7F9|nr:uncharacterized protein LOC116049076 isoform X2 [Sander lucioperca]